MAPSSPLRILALHGYTQNADVMRRQCGALRKALKRDAEFVFLNAPHVLEEHGGALADAAADNERVCESGDISDADGDVGRERVSSAQRYWWRARDEGAVYDGYDDSVAYVDKFMRDTGPYQALFGFSQGAVLAHCLLARRTVGGGDGGGEDDACRDVRFAVAVSGFLPRALHIPLAVRDAHNIGTRTLVVYGQRDSLVPPERTVPMAERYADATMYAHSKGHVIPFDAEARAAIRQFVSLSSSSSSSSSFPSPPPPPPPSSFSSSL